jgi:hypothetical protein
MAVLLVGYGRVGHHSFQPADQVPLLDGTFAADANGPDPMHAVHRLALPESEQGLSVPPAEKRDRFGRARFCQNFAKPKKYR